MIRDILASQLKKEWPAYVEGYMKAINQQAATPPKGDRMPDTKQSWQHLANQYAETIERQKEEIERLKMTVNQLRQRR